MLILLLIVIGILFTIKHIRNKKEKERTKQDRDAAVVWYREQIKLRKKKIDPNV
jgi:glucose uptake protein GlcU